MQGNVKAAKHKSNIKLVVLDNYVVNSFYLWFLGESRHHLVEDDCYLVAGLSED